MKLGLLFASSVVVIAAAVALAACESAANLDVSYAPGAAIDGSADGEAGPPPGIAFEGCPCDESQGFGCCVVPKPDIPFCTADKAVCDEAKGMLLKCFGRRTDDECCFHGTGGAG
jgi:hypothetical protein